MLVQFIASNQSSHSKKKPRLEWPGLPLPFALKRGGRRHSMGDIEMPSKSYQQQHSEAIQNLLSSHFPAIAGRRVLSGSRPKSPRGAKCLVAGYVPPRLQCERRTVYSVECGEIAHGKVGDRWESPGWERLRAKREFSRLRGSLPVMPSRARLGRGLTEALSQAETKGTGPALPRSKGGHHMVQWELAQAKLPLHLNSRTTGKYPGGCMLAGATSGRR